MSTESLPPETLTTTSEIEDEYRLRQRFDRVGRLVGDDGMTRLLNASVMIIGLGGVGSFAAEALARSGIGHIRLVDYDRVCLTNTNRQIQAIEGEIGRHKADALAERLRLINPQAKIESIKQFYDATSSEQLLDEPVDFVLDAIDHVTSKCHLIMSCVRKAIPIVCSTGAAGRIDPTAIRSADLADTRIDPLAQTVRRILRQSFNFPRKGPFGVQAVYSIEHAINPYELQYNKGRTLVEEKNEFHSIEKRRMVYGTAAFITGAFGFACASIIVRNIATG